SECPKDSAMHLFDSSRHLMESALVCFIPIFVAVDPIGVVPMFLSLTRGYDDSARRKIVIDSVLTASVIGIIFVLAGKTIFLLLGIKIQDFAIAGGTLLFILSIIDLLGDGSARVHGAESRALGIFPLGTPLIIGPAVLTTLIILVDTYGFVPALVAFALNLAVLFTALFKADIILSALGENGTRAFAKIMSILLAAIGIMMVRKGIMELIALAR
ncbi:MAG: MarC family protein, partial [Thermodesulfobacteriota bacterium]